MRTVAAILLSLLAGAAVVGCPSAKPSATAPTTAPTTAATTAAATSTDLPPPSAPPAAMLDVKAICTEEIQRERACQDDFVPMIVDTRIKLDLPQGIASRGKTDRAALVAEAKKEFLEDYAPEKLPTICERRQAQAAQPPPAAVKEMKASSDACRATTSCKAFTACMAPILEKVLSMGLESGVD